MTTLSRRPISTSLRGLAAAGALTLALSGCSGGDETPDGGDATPGATASSGADDPDAPAEGTDGGDSEGSEDGADALPEETDPPVLQQAPPITKTEPATEDVTTRGSCGLKPGERTVGGRLTNPTERRLDYVITVSWISDDQRVRGRGVAVIESVRPGASQRWSVTAEVSKDATACVTNALRGRAGS